MQYEPPSMACYIIPNQYCIVLSASLTEHTVHAVWLKKITKYTEVLFRGLWKVIIQPDMISIY